MTSGFPDGALIALAAAELPREFGSPQQGGRTLAKALAQPATEDEAFEAGNRAAIREWLADEQAGLVREGWRIEGAEAAELSSVEFAVRRGPRGAFLADHENDKRQDAAQWEIVPGPGMIQVRARNYALLDRRIQRERETRSALVQGRAHHPGWAALWCAVEAARMGAAPSVLRLLLVGVMVGFAQRRDWEEVRARSAKPKITGWSRKSRNELRMKIGRLDLTPLSGAGRVLEVFALTAPGRGGLEDSDAEDDRFWLLVAPDGAAWHRALNRFRRRYERRWGPLCAVLKLEFQRRGAPHEHFMAGLPVHPKRAGHVHPEFREWLSRTWSECLWGEVLTPTLGPHWARLDDLSICRELERIQPGAALAYLNHREVGTRVGTRERRGRITDPRRAAEYFLKEGISEAKGYQDAPPEQWSGTGRIWQCWRLQEATTTVAVSAGVGIAAGRILRRWYDADQGIDISRAELLAYGPCRDAREQGLRDRAGRIKRRRSGRRPSGAARRARRAREDEAVDAFADELVAADALPFGPCRDADQQAMRDLSIVAWDGVTNLEPDRLKALMRAAGRTLPPAFPRGRSRGLFRQNRGRVLVNSGERMVSVLARHLKSLSTGVEDRVFGIGQRGDLYRMGEGLRLIEHPRFRVERIGGVPAPP